MYLEYLLLSIIIILVYILSCKLIDIYNVDKVNRVIEGFEHIGKAVVAENTKHISVGKLTNKREDSVIAAGQSSYFIAADVSKVFIKTPYKIMNNIWEFFKSLLKPMLDFAHDLYKTFSDILLHSIIRPIIKQIKKVFRMWLHFIKHLPENIKKMFNIGFSYVEKMTTFGVNIFKILIKIPEGGLMYAINLENKVLDSMG